MTKTYRFYANMSFSDEIEVEADSYDKAFELAHVEAMCSYSVYTPTGLTAPWNDIQIEDSYIPEDDE